MNLPDTIELVVTKEDEAKGIRKSRENCPIAWSIKRTLNKPCKVGYGIVILYKDEQLNQEEVRYQLTTRGVLLAMNFDNTGKIDDENRTIKLDRIFTPKDVKLECY